MQRSDLLALDFYKKSPFKGSIQGMCYMVTGKIRDEELPEGSEAKPKKLYHFEVCLWPGPLNFEKTNAELKQYRSFPERVGNFFEEDLVAVAEYINAQYEEQKPLWDTVRYR